jgi:hypothetical protein
LKVEVTWTDLDGARPQRRLRWGGPDGDLKMTATTATCRWADLNCKSATHRFHSDGSGFDDGGYD